MVRQPPKLLTRVIRAIAELHELRGSTVPTIVTQVRVALNEAQINVRNVAMQVRRALKHAVDNGLILQRAGKFRVAGRKRVIPVDSLEMQVDCRRRKARRTKRCACGRRKSDMDYQIRGRTTRRRGPYKKRIRSKTTEKSQEQKTDPDKNVTQQPQQKKLTPSTSATNIKSSSIEQETSKSNYDNEGQRQEQRRQTPYPEFNKGGTSVAPTPAEKRRRVSRRCRMPIPPPLRNNQEGPPNIQDEPMDPLPAPRLKSVPRNISPRRYSVPRHRENNPDEVKETDSLDENHDHPPSYYN